MTSAEAAAYRGRCEVWYCDLFHPYRPQQLGLHVSPVFFNTGGGVLTERQRIGKLKTS